jgi:hypothetical protein
VFAHALTLLTKPLREHPKSSRRREIFLAEQRKGERSACAVRSTSSGSQHVGLFVLVGVAAATQPHPQTADVSAAFTADQTRSHSRTCTQDGNTFRITNAVWRGTSTSAEPRLAGNLVISTRTVVNETTGDGGSPGPGARRPSPMKPGKGGRPHANARLSASSTTATTSTASPPVRFGLRGPDCSATGRRR